MTELAYLLEAQAPWHNVAAFIPKGYVINEQGVFIDKDDPELISGPCWVEDLTRFEEGKGWGYVFGWLDQDGKVQREAFPAHKLTERSTSHASELHSFGLRVVPGKQQKLMTYLGSFQLPLDYRRQTVSKLGWLDTAREHPVYVLPDRTISIDLDENIIFQPEEHSPASHTLHSRGSLAQWQTFVAEPCKGNTILVFSACVAFAGPQLRFAGVDCGGFHLYGASSKGKTTALQVGASAWGCGAGPAISQDSYIGRWNTTGNALEATAAAYNDRLLALDEMGTCDARDFGKVIYDLFGGKGKSRLNKKEHASGSAHLAHSGLIHRRNLRAAEDRGGFREKTQNRAAGAHGGYSHP
jgi:putative DNA primase/helicase